MDREVSRSYDGSETDKRVHSEEEVCVQSIRKRISCREQETQEKRQRDSPGYLMQIHYILIFLTFKFFRSIRPRPRSAASRTCFTCPGSNLRSYHVPRA